MAGNTIMTAKNSFSEGLLMDFSPDNTQANCMTSALNATLITFNGNEMSLQNDMGNGRVETAYLPDGYIPVGTCEFGDIIYIISYNPILDKALIGCFPSPERNISSEELNNLPIDESLKSSDFLVFENGSPTGKLKTTSVKKILFKNDLHPGDKYIIASSEIDDSKNTISAYGSDKYDIEDFPKLVKIHIVSIEESGKINYLDSSVKWYENGQDPYFISNSVSPNRDKIDIDSYRNLISSGYSVFSSKTSGLLALLVELEKITGFNCTWECFKTGESTSTVNSTTIKNTIYDVFFNFSWTTNHNDINPNGAVLELGKWEKSNESGQVTYNYWKKDTDNNGNDILSLTASGNISIPTSSTDFLFSRHYCPENNITYSNYKNTYNYETYVNTNFPNSIKIIRKVDTNGIPDFDELNAKYVLDCDKIVIDNGNLKYQSYDGTRYNEITNFFIPGSDSSLKDSIINNKFKYPITKKLGTFTIPTHTYIQNTYTDKNDSTKTETVDEYKENNLSNLVYLYKVVPTMPYGKLDEFAQEGCIDFSKIGKENIKLTSWKYYTYENTSTLTWAMDAYTDVGKVISSVEFEFYNKDGLVARIEHKGYNSYNGQFTDYLILNRERGNGNILNTDYDGNTLTVTDAGIIKSNNLYLVKINVYQGTKSPTGDIIINNDYTKTEYRWFWTNQMFNELYQYVSDFDNIQMTLGLDCNVLFSQTNSWKPHNEIMTQSADNVTINSNNLIDSLSATKQIIGYEDENNIQANLTINLNDTFNTFVLDPDSTFIVDTVIGSHDIVNVPENPTIRYSQEDTGNSVDYILPINDETLDLQDPITGSPLNDPNGYRSYKNYAKLSLKDINTDYNKDLIYVSSSGNSTKITPNKVNRKTDITPSGTSYNLNFKATHYSKYCYYTSSEVSSCNILKPFLYNVSDLLKYNLKIYNDSVSDKELWFNECYVAAGGNISYDKQRDGDDRDLWDAGITTFASKNTLVSLADCYSCTWNTNRHSRRYREFFKDAKTWSSGTKNTAMTRDIESFIFPYVFGWIPAGHNDNDNEYIKYARIPISNNVNNLTTKLEGYQTVELNEAGKDVIKHMTMCFRDETGLIYLNGPSNNSYGSNNDYKSYHKYYVSTADIRKYLNGLVGLLTQCYYISNNTEDEYVFYKSNYIYLDNNYSEYSADFVANIEQNNSNVQINGINLNTYVNSIVNKIDASDSLKQKLNSKINVNPIFTGCVKTFPVLIRINYIKPTFESKPSSNSRLILKSGEQSIKDNADMSQITSFNIGDIYVYSDNKFVSITSNPLITIGEIRFNTSGSNLIISSKNTTNDAVTLNFTGISEKFRVSNDTLVLKNLPSSSEMYNIITSYEYLDDSRKLNSNSLMITECPATMYLYNF